MEMVGPLGLEPDDVGYVGLLGYMSRITQSWTVLGIRYAWPYEAAWCLHQKLRLSVERSVSLSGAS